MADQYGLFWNSVNNDRGYTADSFAEWLNHFFTTGVFSGELQVTAASGMDIKVGSGYANLKGKVRFFDSATKLTLATAGATYPRIDTVVVERNDTDRKISIKVVTGTYNGSSPSPTAPVRSAAIYQIVLAQIYVAAGATKITQENITDTRSNNSVCGIVTGTVKEMDYSQFAAQFNSYYSNFKTSNKADFDTWFNGIKGQLTSDAAAKLQTALNELNNNGPNVLHEYVSRPASADDIPGDDKKLKWFIFEGGYIIQFSWDNSNWASQLYIPASDSERATPQFRARNAIENKWGKWIDIYSGSKPQSSVTKSFTLSASSWSSGSYAISDSLITASSNQEILPATTITAAQYNALSKAQIIDGGQSEGSLTLKALGTVPTIDIPIRIIFRGTI